jgi:hypothetical protein
MLVLRYSNSAGPLHSANLEFASKEAKQISECSGLALFVVLQSQHVGIQSIADAPFRSIVRFNQPQNAVYRFQSYLTSTVELVVHTYEGKSASPLGAKRKETKQTRQAMLTTTIVEQAYVAFDATLRCPPA